MRLLVAPLFLSSFIIYAGPRTISTNSPIPLRPSTVEKEAFIHLLNTVNGNFQSIQQLGKDKEVTCSILKLSPFMYNLLYVGRPHTALSDDLKKLKDHKVNGQDAGKNYIMHNEAIKNEVSNNRPFMCILFCNLRAFLFGTRV